MLRFPQYSDSLVSTSVVNTSEVSAKQLALFNQMIEADRILWYGRIQESLLVNFVANSENTLYFAAKEKETGAALEVCVVPSNKSGAFVRVRPGKGTLCALIPQLVVECIVMSKSDKSAFVEVSDVDEVLVSYDFESETVMGIGNKTIVDFGTVVRVSKSRPPLRFIELDAFQAYKKSMISSYKFLVANIYFRDELNAWSKQKTQALGMSVFYQIKVRDRFEAIAVRNETGTLAFSLIAPQDLCMDIPRISITVEVAGPSNNGTDFTGIVKELTWTMSKAFLDEKTELPDQGPQLREFLRSHEMFTSEIGDLLFAGYRKDER